jgi:hypothetical protein
MSERQPMIIQAIAFIPKELENEYFRAVHALTIGYAENHYARTLRVDRPNSPIEEAGLR